jgi:quercetin dioxygenase-like cupin family protein
MSTTRLSDATLHTTPAAEMRRYPGTAVAVWHTTAAPATSGPNHRIDREQVVVVIKGELTAQVDGATIVASAGDAVVLPAGAVRQLRNDGSGVLHTVTAAVPGSLAQVGEADPIVVPWSV